MYFISNDLLMINKINKSDKSDKIDGLNKKDRLNKTKITANNIMKGGNEEKTIITDEERKLADERGPVPEYDNTGTNVYLKFVNIIKYIWAIYKYYVWYFIKTHKIEVGLLLGLIAYIITVVIIFANNPYELITEKNAGVGIFISIFGAFMILLSLFYYIRRKQLFPDETKYERNTSNISFIGKIMTSVLTIGIVLGLVYLIFNAASYFNDFSEYFLFGINALIFLGLGTIVYKIVSSYLKEGANRPPGDKKPTWFGLFFKAIGYIPCLILQLMDYIKEQYHITSSPILIILLIEVVLISIYFLYPIVMEHIMSHDAESLIKEPSNLNISNSLGTFGKLNFVKDKFQYKYAVSGWIYLDSFPPETNSNYEKYTSLLNIGNKPNISYNVLKNKLQIKMENQGKEDQILYETDKFYMQKWNHIVINYDGSTMDIFINNELVSSTNGVVPYNGNTVITSGYDGGLFGGICNVRYFKDSISRGRISWLYNSVKNLNPPII